MLFGDRIHSARKSSGLSQRDLGYLVGVSAMSISKYENDTVKPNSQMLIKISAATKKSLDFFFRSSSISLSDVCYRCKKSISAKDIDRIHGQITDWMERYTELEHLCDEIYPIDLPIGERCIVRDMDDVERVASIVREQWDLGLDPIENLIDVLEMHGIKVGLVDGSVKFDALTLVSDSEEPVIAINKNMAGDRQRFSLAHELGHLVLKVHGNLDEEKAANRFAGALLVPKDMALFELKEHRTRLDVNELYRLKHKYGMSMAAWIYRAKDLGIISENVAVGLNKLFSRNKWRKKEPEKQVPSEYPTHMELMVRRAMSEEKLSKRKAEELFGMPMSDIANISCKTR